MSDVTIKQLTKKLIAFRDERDWRQFHSLKELILSLNLEAAELLELTQWQDASQFDATVLDPSVKKRLEEECADVFLYLLLICERADIDLLQVASHKVKRNGEKYPVEKAKGSASKYTRL